MNMKTQRTCIFCGTRGHISKEHFWPNWLSQYLPKFQNDGNISEVYAAEGLQPKNLKFKKERQGNVITKTIRAVCQTCNNGWMSSLEEKVKPILIAGIHGNNSALNQLQIVDLAHWVCVKSIVGEYSAEETALTPSEDRYLVYKQAKIPDYFRIYLGRHSCTTQAAYVRHSATVSRTMQGPNPILPIGITRNIQSTTFLVGPLFFHLTAARVKDLDLDNLLTFKKIEKLWPTANTLINLDSLQIIDSRNLTSLTRTLDHILLRPGVRYGGPLN